MSVLGRLFTGERRDWAGPWGPYSDGRIPANTWDGGITGSIGNNAYVSERTALHLVDAYACVTLLADSVSMLPLDGFRRAGGVATELDPVPSLIAQPDPEIERWDFVSRLVTSMALRGNAYAAVLGRSPAGWPTGLRAVHPDDISPRRNKRTGRKEYKLADGTVTGDAHLGGDIVHIPLVTLAGDVAGLSPIDCARRGLRLSINTESFGDRWFTEGAAPSSVLESDEAVDDDEARKIQARWIASHGGRRRPAVLTSGLKWRAVTITPNESQFLETRNLNTASTARIWRVPPHMIGHVEKTTSWGSGIEEQGIGYTVFTLGPYLTRLEAAFTRLMPRPQYSKFKVGALLRGNTKDRYLSYAIARQWGWLSVNDIRALEDLPPVAGGDIYLQPLNMIDAEKALQILLDKSTGGPPA